MNAFMDGAREINPKVEFMVTFINTWFDPPKAKEAAFAMIDKGADVMYAERFGVSDAAKEKGKLAIGNVINTQDKYPDTVVASALWNMEPTIDRALKAVKDGKFKAEDYGPYSMMKYKGSRAGAARHVREEGAGGPRGQGAGQGRRRSSTASSPSRSTTASPSRREVSRRRARPSTSGHPCDRMSQTVLRLDGHHQALRRAGGQRRRLARAARAARCWRCSARTAPASRRWCRSCSATTSPTRGRSRPSAGRCRRANPRPRWPPASAWCTSTSRWPTT